jgi:hemolysin III
MPYLDFREPFSAWSHGLWLLLSVPATLVLWRRCCGDRAKRLSLLVFGLSLAACYLGSMLYHGVRLQPDGIDLFERLDHIGIHLLIAGSYTPVAWNLMRGRWRWTTLAAVWVTTMVGSSMLLMNYKLPLPLATSEYLALGWGALFCYFEIARVLSHRALRPLVVGGVLYSVGALLNLLHWPVLWPGVFGSHEMFHLWVMAGSGAHFWFMLTAVVPFARVANGRAEAEALTTWDPARAGEPRTVLRIDLLSGRLHQG